MRPQDARERRDGVRPLETSDIPALVRLHKKVYGERSRALSKSSGEELATILLRHPWNRQDMPSLVYEDFNGDVIGYLGVLPRPMLFNGRQITAAVIHSFMVYPERRTTMAALHLIKHFFSLNHDFVVANANNISRRILENAGAITAIPWQLNWTRSLKPGQHLRNILRNRGVEKTIVWSFTPAFSLADLVIPRILKSTFRLAECKEIGEILTPSKACALIGKFTAGLALVPCYDEPSFQWLIDVLTRNARYGELHRTLVRGAGGEILGWYLYYLRPNRMVDVVHLMANLKSVDEVLNHLFLDSKRRGAIAVTGRVDPRFMRNLSEQHCIFHCINDSTLMVHSRNPEILRAIESGKAFLGRLESEWWISTVLG